MAMLKIKKSLRRSGFKEPVQMAGIMMLFIIGVVTFPTQWIVELFYKGGDELVLRMADGITRLIFSVMMLYFIGNFGFRVIPRKTHIIDLLVVIPALIIAVNNFPFVAYINGDCSLTEDAGGIIMFAVWCIGVGLFEEISFRGVILPLTLIFLKDKKRPVFFTIAVSSAVFALTHLVNLFSGNIGGTILQVGYTFLIGAMCGIVTVKTGNVFISALVHIVYNFCGMLVEYCGKGVMWTWPQIICTAVVGVIIGVVMIVIAVRSDNLPENVFNMLGEDDLPEVADSEGAATENESNTTENNV